VARGGHLSNLDQPHAYTEIIRQFLMRRVRIAA
jgi:hypothetical protein